MPLRFRFYVQRDVSVVQESAVSGYRNIRGSLSLSLKAEAQTLLLVLALIWHLIVHRRLFVYPRVLINVFITIMLSSHQKTPQDLFLQEVFAIIMFRVSFLQTPQSQKRVH